MALPIQSVQDQHLVFVPTLKPHPIHPQGTSSKHCKDSSENTGSCSILILAASCTKDKPILESSKVKSTSKGKKPSWKWKKKQKEINQNTDVARSTDRSILEESSKVKSTSKVKKSPPKCQKKWEEITQKADVIHPPGTTSKHCKDSSENTGSCSVSLPAASCTNDRPILESSKVKSTSKGKRTRKKITQKEDAFGLTDKPILESSKVKSKSKGKKKRKEITQRADAAGSGADLFDAYEGSRQNTFSLPGYGNLQIMHKAEKKYEVGKVADDEQTKQRRLKSILNKLTPQNFERLFEQVKAVNIDNAVTLTGLISQIFEKALMEPAFCEMYANFCFHLAAVLPDFSQDNKKINFKRLLLNKCQEEFERGEREQEVNKADEEKRTKARKRMLGNIRLIGELYKKGMLIERTMHECINKLMGQYKDPDGEDVEALCELMCTIGEVIDHPNAKEQMDAYFVRMRSLSNKLELSSRVRFILKDVIDFRNNKWHQRRKVEGPKKIDELHRDASQERQVQAGMLGHGSGNSATGRIPMDFGPRRSSMLSSNARMGGLHGMHIQGPTYADAIVTAVSAKKYSRDFLLKLAEQCTELPEEFEVAADIAEKLMTVDAFQSLLHKAGSKYELGKVGDASQERQVQAGMLGHGSGNSATGRIPMDFGPRRSSMLSSNARMGGLHGMHIQGPTYADAIATAVSAKKYSRDFLLKLAEQCTELPEGFEVAADIAEKLMTVDAFQSLLHKAGSKYELGKVGDEKEANQRQPKVALDDRLDQLFLRLDNLQCYVRERLDLVDNNIASLDYRMRRLQYYPHNAK